MAKQLVKFGLEVEFDEEEAGMPARVWLYQLINRINYQHKVKKVIYGDKQKTFNKKTEDVKELKLREEEDI